MYFDEVFDYVGEVGVYQVFLLCYIFALGLVSIDAIRMNFIGGSMEHWCHIPALENFTYEKQKDIAIPETANGYSSCHRFPFNFSQYSLKELFLWNRSEQVQNMDPSQWVACDSGWVFDQSQYISTIGSQVGTAPQLQA